MLKFKLGCYTGGPSAGRWARRSGGRRARVGAAGAGRHELGLGCGPCGAGKRAGAREGVGRYGLGRGRGLDWAVGLVLLGSFPFLFLNFSIPNSNKV